MKKSKTLGALPKSDRNDELDDLGVNALSSALPVDRFRVRAEPGKDRGVDRYVEIKVDGFDTNLRAQIQLKSKEKLKENTDGSISKSVEVSNINYLLNGPCPMYVLYTHETGELRYVWLREEVHKLNEDKPNWDDGETVTLRFSRRIDLHLEEIHSQIFAEGRRAREVNQRLSKATLNDQVILNIDMASQTILDSIEAKEILSKMGTTLVMHGHPSTVMKAFKLLSEKDRSNVRIQLVAAYAEFAMSRYDHALGHIKECLLQRNELKEDDSWFLEELKNSCEYCLGIKSRDEYVQYEDELASLRPGILSLNNQLEVLKNRLLTSKEPEERTELLNQMESIANDIKTYPDASEPMKLGAEVVLLYVTGQVWNSEMMIVIASQAIQTKLPMDGMPNFGDKEKELFEQWNQWHQRSEELLKRVVEAEHPILLADLVYSRAVVTTHFLINIKASAKIGWLKEPNWFIDLLKSAISDAELAKKNFENSKCLHSQLLAELILADLMVLSGKDEKAVEIGRNIHAISSVMGYKDLEAMSDDMQNGKSIYQRLALDIDDVAEQDDELELSRMSDSEVMRMSKDLSAATGLPDERVPNVYHDMLTQRLWDQEKFSWCKHLELIQNLLHTIKPETRYVEKPYYIWRCVLKGFESSVEHQNYKSLYEEFKSKYCINCNKRSQKTAKNI